MLKVLIVTDTPSRFREFMGGLTESGADLETAASGRSALELLAANGFHLAVVDRELPDVTGLALVPKLVMADAMLNTALVSDLGPEEFHETSEGLGVLAQLPMNPGKAEAEALRDRLREVTIQLNTD